MQCRSQRHDSTISVTLLLVYSDFWICFCLHFAKKGKSRFSLFNLSLYENILTLYMKTFWHYHLILGLEESSSFWFSIVRQMSPGADPEPPLPGGGGGHKGQMKPKASLRREAPKGGGWGKGWPPPAGGGPGGLPRKFFEKLHQNGAFWVHFEVINTHFLHWKFIWKKMRLTKFTYTCRLFIFFLQNFWEIYIKTVHSEHILISISTTQILYIKVSHYI